MQLSVPQRGPADRDSFPVEPADVEQWLAGLSLASENDAREIHRGLKHSNRLHNDPVRRRAVLERFLPVLRDLHARLAELTRAQPLPLVREFAREVALVEALLREEAFAFKILLADSAGAGPEPEDARLAMLALARRADVIVHGYRRLPDALFEDAHALYTLSESHGLLGAGGSTGIPGIADHYHYLLLLSVADTHQIRARQLPLALDFLREAAAADVTLEHVAPEALTDVSAHGDHAFAVDLARGTRPERVASLLVAEPDTLRLFDVAPVLARVDRAIGHTRTVRGNTLGVDVLERQTLGRLRTAFGGERVRRGARTVANVAQPALFGHKEITTRLLFDSAHADSPDDAATAALEGEGWTLVNRSAQGACLHHPACLPGTVQVGELVSLDAPLAESGSEPAGERAATLLGTVRWVRSGNGAEVRLGLEYLARGVMPVSVMPTAARPTAARPITDGETAVAENALIIACKVQQSIVQTILLPPYLHEVGAQLTARQGNRSRRLRLRTALQTNSLFGHFVIE